MSVSNHSLIPQARNKDLVVEHLADETLVYDLENQKAHCLNRFASLVWQKCDGRRSIDEVGNLVATELNMPVRNEGVLLALEQLDKAALLQSAPARFDMDRRKMLKVAGIAVAVGAVATIVAPTAARASSLQRSGGSALDASQCQNGIVKGDGTCL